MSVLCLDLEASGLGPGGFPVEVAIAYVTTGQVLSWLIRPIPEWLSSGRWDDDAEAVHGLSLALLQRDGLAPQVVAEELTSHLWGALVLSDNPVHDAAWIRALYRAAGASNAPCQVQSLAGHIEQLEPSAAILEATEVAALVAYPNRHRAGPDASRLAYVIRALSSSA